MPLFYSRLSPCFQLCRNKTLSKRITVASKSALGEMNPNAMTAANPSVVVIALENVIALGSGGASGSVSISEGGAAGAGGGARGGCGHTFSPPTRTDDILTASSFSSMKN